MSCPVTSSYVVVTSYFRRTRLGGSNPAKTIPYFLFLDILPTENSFKDNEPASDSCTPVRQEEEAKLWEEEEAEEGEGEG